MLTDPAFWMIAVPGVIIAGIAKGGFSGGAAFVATPMLALSVGPTNAAAIMLPLLMVMDAIAVRAYWGKWSAPDARLMILGAIPGIALGTVLFGVVDERIVKAALGLMAVGFVAFMVARSRAWIAVKHNTALSKARASFWGGVCGFTSFVAHAGGPPASMHLLSRSFAKTEYQATHVIVFAAINAMKLPCYAALGLFIPGNLTASLALAPIAALGIGIGVIAHRKVPDRWFFAVIYTCLTIVGVKLIAESLT